MSQAATHTGPPPWSWSISTVLAGLIYIGLGLLLLTPLIITSGTLFPFIVGKALFARSIIEIIFAIWIVLLITTPSFRPPRSWVLIAFGVYIATALLSAAFGVKFIHSFWSDFERMSGTWDLMHWFVLALVTASVVRSSQVWRYLLTWNLIVVVGLGLIAVNQLVGSPRISPLVYQCRLDATLGNPTFFSAILGVATIVALGLFASSFVRKEENAQAEPSSRSTARTRQTRPISTLATLAIRYAAIDKRIIYLKDALILIGAVFAIWLLFQGDASGGLRGFEAVLIVIILASALFGNRRVFWLLTALFTVWLLFQTGSRGGLLGLAAGLVVMPVGLAISENRELVAEKLSPFSAMFRTRGRTVFVILAATLVTALLALAVIEARDSVVSLLSFIWSLVRPGSIAGLLGRSLIVVAALVALGFFGHRKALIPVVAVSVGVILVAMTIFTYDRTFGFPLPAGCGENADSGSAPSARLLSTSGGASGGAASTADTRLTLVSIAIEAWKDRPIFGWGQANFDRAFDRYAEISLYKHGLGGSQDQVHNKVFEELVTKGILGTVAYLSLWGILVWGIVRRRRPPREEIMAYAILGALTAYFVQNLFLFDTPATALQWALLVGWVASQDSLPAALPAAGRRLLSPVTGMLQRVRGTGQIPRDIADVIRAGAVAATIVTVILSVFFLNYRPYSVANDFPGAIIQSGPLRDRLELAIDAFETPTAPSSDLRALMFERLTMEWNTLNPQDRQQVINFMSVEGKRAFDADPDNARLLMTALPILQVTASTRTAAAVDQLSPLVQNLVRLAPERLATHQILARQELFEGNFLEALRVAEEFEALAPVTVGVFDNIKQAAQAGIDAQESNK